KEFRLLANIHEDLIISDVLDQFRTFCLIEKYLQTPTLLAEQWTFQITSKTQRLLVAKYYDFDDGVIREILGKKLSGRNRKDLDDVSEKTNVRLKSCRRQFDNIKRVYKIVEDLSGNLVINIQTHFLLPENLAKKYATVVYIANNRFETSKRKLQYLKFDDFLHCAYEMMSNWCCHNPECRFEETAMDMDREFLQMLRELKILTEREYLDDHKLHVMRSLKGKISERVLADLDTIFKSLSRSIINIASGLNHSKEVRDLFLDVVEKVIEPFKQIRMTKTDVELFITNYTEIPRSLEPFKV
ncbi:growth hormone-inducible transmembrane-like protein, partial [Leptotrombidium deliense]